jgi:hypothetical protein
VYTCSFLLKGMLSEEKEEKAAGLAHYFSRVFGAQKYGFEIIWTAVPLMTLILIRTVFGYKISDSKFS